MNKFIVLNIIFGFTLNSLAATNYECKVSKAGNAVLSEDVPYTLKLEEQRGHIFVTLEGEQKELTAHQFKGSKTAFVSTYEDEKDDFYVQANPVYIHLSHSLAEHGSHGEISLTPRWSDDYARVDILDCKKDQKEDATDN